MVRGAAPDFQDNKNITNTFIATVSVPKAQQAESVSAVGLDDSISKGLNEAEELLLDPKVLLCSVTQCLRLRLGFKMIQSFIRRSISTQLSS